ncbi:Rv1733c family protein [Nonomuraea turcica]|uniref:Rv1733c family protein n=1 Tax=Nonomuraea sp. G32 TaxID=3067274 RepID=UPI00273A9676|nr:hypothetical protein [Nonomuraea sp. G32]MDP4510509.1 hypothetical protein [Nonomuraea sp. G32]
MKSSIHPVMLRVRLYRHDDNPLRRHSDRLESVFVLAALVLVLVSLWPAVVAGRAVYEGAVQDQSAGTGVRRQVMATLTQDAPPARVSFSEVPAAQPETMARWTTAEGAARCGFVPAPSLAKAGSVVPVWIDAAGAPASPPADSAVLAMRGMVMGLLVVLGTGLLVLTAFLVFRRRLDRVRYGEWDAAWVRAGEQRRRPRQP